MKGIYGGSIVEVTDYTDFNVKITENGITSIVLKTKVVQVTEEEFRLVDEELQRVKGEIRDVTSRMHRLEGEYFKKKNLLQEILMDARSKEIAIVSSLIKSGKAIDKD